MRKKQIWARTMAVAMSVTMAAGTCPATVLAVTGDAAAADGTYSSTAHVSRTAEDDEDENEWNEYDVNVSLTVQDGVFSDITVGTAGGYEATNDSYLAKAYTSKKYGIKTLLVGQPATEATINSWDTMSGATRTSDAVKAAALAAVQGAPEKTEEETYKYVYAGMTWAEYWANENVQAAGSTSASETLDSHNEFDRGAFDTVTRATTNHGLHRGSFQCSATIYMKDGTTYDVAYYTGATTAVLTNGETVAYDKANIDHYVVTGLKYVPVKVAESDYEDFCQKYKVVENGGTLSGGYTEMNLNSYNNFTADVTENTNGLKTAVKLEDGSYSFSEKAAGTESGIAGAALKSVSDGAILTVKEASGSYGEFLRVDITGDYGDLGANMQAVKWTYYGEDSTYTTPLASYGTKFAADNWMHKSNGIQLGLTNSLRCSLPEGTTGVGYWTVTVSALGYSDTTWQIQATKENIVGADPVTDTSVIEAAIAKAEGLTKAVYTTDSWSSMQAELTEAKDALSAAKSQASLDEAVVHLNEAMDALQSQYVLMNIPYAAFYQADLSNDVAVDAFTSATLNKTRTGSLAGGSYHVNSDGSDVTGVTFPVKLGEGVDLSKFTKITDESSVDITVTNRGTTSTTTYTGKDALFESASYSYYTLNELPAYYKDVTVDEKGNLQFGQVVGEVQEAKNVEATLLTSTSYGDYQLDLDGLTDTISTDSQVYGVIISTKEGASYGLRHLENIWRVSELAWCTGFTNAVHNCPTSSDHYKAMMGQTINKVTYYTSQGIYEVPLSVYVPVKFQSDLTVADAALTAGETAVTFESLPADYDPQYRVDGLDDVKVKDGKLTFTGGNVGDYTLNVTDKSGKYADVSASFTLTSAENPVVYNEEQMALAKAEGATDAELSNYIKNITSVSVNGTAYPASGKGAVALIKEDGSLITDAAPFAEAKAGQSFEITVTSTGYTEDYTFTYQVAGQEPHWVQEGNRYKYMNEDGSYSTSKWQTIDGKDYYFGADGYRVTGWKYLSGKWYYMNTSGVKTTGWQKVSSKWYYMDKNGIMTTGWQKVGGKWYYMKSSGAMATGWVKVGSKWYYMKSSGAMTTGWVKVGSKWYYMKSSGAMTTGWQKVGGKWYYMFNSGAMAAKQWIGKYYVNGSGVWTKTK